MKDPNYITNKPPWGDEEKIPAPSDEEMKILIERAREKFGHLKSEEEKIKKS